MKMHSDKPPDWDSQREKIIGLGKTSIHKSYYPELRRRLLELLKKNEELHSAYEQLTAREEELREKYDELSRRELELRESEMRWRRLVEHSPVSIAVHQGGKIAYINPAGLKLIGASNPETVIGKPVLDFVHPDFKEVVRSRIQQMLEQDLPAETMEEKFLRLDGTDFDVEVTAIPMVFKGKRSILTVNRDITERKVAEEALKEAYDRLEIRVQERTAALRESEERLRLKLDSVLSPDTDITDLELLNILDIPIIQSTMEDFSRLTGIATAVIDLQGNVIVAAGWQDICTKFFRVNDTTARFCTESDLYLAKNVKSGEYVVYKCKNNLWDVVTPLYIGNNHVCNIYTGQFFYDHEIVDEDAFIVQAEKYGFGQEEFVAALHRVPRYSREEIMTQMDFLMKFTGFISKLSYSNLKLARIMVEQKRISEALTQSKQQLTDIINHLPDATFAIDRWGTTIVWNKAIEEMTGIKAEDILGKGNFEYALPFYGERRPVLVDLVLKGDEVIEKSYSNFLKKEGDILVADTILQKPLGETVYLWGKATPLNDDEGNKIGAIESVRDVTDRKRSEEALRKSEERFRGIASNLPGIVYQFYARDTGEWGMYFVDERSEDIYGLKPEPLDTWYERFSSGIAPEDRDRWVESIKNVVLRVVPWQFEGRFIKPTGEEMYIRGLSQPIRLQGETVWNGILLDITDRKRVEEALKKSEEQYRTIFENSGSPLMIIDEDTTILLVNREFETFSGYCKDEIEGRRSWTEFIADQNVLEMMKTYHQLRRTNPDSVPVSYESRIVTGRGEIRDVIITAAMIPRTKQSLVALVDISERKRAEEDLQRLYGELEIRVERRTEELRQAQEAYRQANTKLNLLNTITRHDILNQLTALIGFLELCAESVSNPDELRHFIVQGEKAAKTIEHQILFTRDYQDMGVKAPAWQSVSDNIKQATIGLPMRNVTVVIERVDLEVFADPLFEKVFYNLIDNALRYGGDQLKKIRIFTMESETMLIIVCEDDGSGITQADKNNLFKRGFGKHTGLGLFLSREILSITGITIIETGEPGKGARFEIIVPKGGWRLATSK